RERAGERCVKVGPLQRLAHDALQHVVVDQRPCNGFGKRPREQPVDQVLDPRGGERVDRRVPEVSTRLDAGVRAQSCSHRVEDQARGAAPRGRDHAAVPLLPGSACHANREAGTPRKCERRGRRRASIGAMADPGALAPVVPFHDPSRKRRLIKVVLWLAAIVVFVEILSLLGVDVKSWLSSVWTQMKAVPPGYIVAALIFQTGQTVLCGLSYYG